MEKSPFSPLTPVLGALKIKINAIKSVLTEEQQIAVDAYIQSAAAKFAESHQFDEKEREIFAKYLE
jgi:hypothetical protein